MAETAQEQNLKVRQVALRVIETGSTGPACRPR
ncbi:hypothetical protein [Actinoallomurus sp. NBC_01490]